MRCVEVTRELSAPTGAVEATDLARHLATCPRCAAWSGRAERFDRLWDATRPPEPEPGAFDALWERVSRASAATAGPGPDPMTLPLPARPGRPGRLGLVALAMTSAAALLIAALPYFRRPDGDKSGAGEKAPLAGVEKKAPASAASWGEPAFDVDEGETLVIILDEPGALRVDRREFEDDLSSTDQVALNFDLFNLIEAKAELRQ